MSRIAYVNGRYLPHAQASVHVEDRGYQFADGVYEVCEIYNGGIVDLTRHLDRLERSLSELSIAMPVTRSALIFILKEVVRRNGVSFGLVYLQVTRGVAPRNHVFPAPDTPPALVVTAKAIPRAFNQARAKTGINVITLPDNRWQRVDIKSVSLLPNVLARQTAKEQGADEAWFVDSDGYVTEGAATTAWIITNEGNLITRPDGTGILPGITRRTAMDLIAAERMTVQERKFTVEDAKAAREAFITAASTLVMPVVKVDDFQIGEGKPGPIATKLLQKFHDIAEIVSP